jgi:hypothetical protein
LDPRIYALIDFDGDLSKIHENNNKSWNILQQSGISAIAENDEIVTPNEYKLRQDYPNPFNPATMFEFSLPKAQKVKIEFYCIIGQQVGIVSDKPMVTGIHEITFSADHLPSGVYFCRIQAGQWDDVKKMVLLK